jgi:membrane protease YdiL (CAAX protease family)
MGYRPTSWLPTKITVAVAGVVVAVAILLWRRRPLVAIGIVIAFVAIAVPWFIEDGYEQTMQNGRPVCCGREISREWLRTGIVVVGSGAGAVVVGIGLVRGRRRGIRAPALQS